MKIKSKPQKANFTPFEMTLTFETKQEVIEFLLRFAIRSHIIATALNIPDPGDIFISNDIESYDALFEAGIKAVIPILKEIINAQLAPVLKMLPAPQKTDRAALNQLVRAYAARNNQDHATAWGMLYNECYYRLHINLRQRAQGAEMPVIDFIETEGLLSQVLAVAKELFI